MINYLFITVFILTIISYYISNRRFDSPSFAFSVGMLLSSAFATLYAKRWDLELEVSTYLIITGGVAIFVLIHSIFNLVKPMANHKRSIEIKDIDIETSKILIFVLFELATIYLSIRALRSVTGIKNASLSEAIISYRNDMVTDNEMNFPTLVSFMRLIVTAAEYWFGYLIANSFIVSRKIRIKYIVPFFLGVICSLLAGGRNQAINCMVNIVASGFVLYYYKSDKRKIKKGSTKIIIRVGIAGTILLIGFQQLGNLLGRSSLTAPLDYLAVYCGASIDNFDSVMKNFVYRPHELGKSQTFAAQVQWLGKYIGIERTNEDILLFRKAKDMTLGNVYTTYYPFVYDYNFLGTIIILVIIAIVSILIYRKANKFMMIKRPSVWIIAYSYLYSSLLFSFFSNKFFEQNFTQLFFRILILCWLFNVVFIKFRFRRIK